MTHRELMAMPLRGERAVGRFTVTRCTVESWCIAAAGVRTRFGAAWTIAECARYALEHDALPPE